MTAASEYRLVIAGLGVMIPDQITQQVFRAMNSCMVIYTVVNEPPQMWLGQEALKLVEVVNVMSLYQEGALRSENYDRVIETIMEAVDLGRTVGYVTYGNPMAYDSVAQGLVLKAQARGIPFAVLPGISSMDSVLCDLGVDMAPGIQIYEATWMVAFGVHPRADVHALITQVGTFGSFKTHYSKRWDGSALSGLVDHLRTVYPAEHVVRLVRATAFEGQATRVRSVPLDDLPTVSAEDLSGTTLYIPAVEAPRSDRRMIQQFRSS